MVMENLARLKQKLLMSILQENMMAKLVILMNILMKKVSLNKLSLSSLLLRNLEEKLTRYK